MQITVESHDILFDILSSIAKRNKQKHGFCFSCATINCLFPGLKLPCGSCACIPIVMPKLGGQVHIENVTDWTVVVQRLLALRGQKDREPPESNSPRHQ